MSNEHPQIAMSAPDIDADDIAAVVEVLRSGRLALGGRQDEFERRVAEYVGVEHAVAVSSGTAALHLLVRALGIGPGDEVLVPSFTFAASVNCVLYEGATPVFVDIESDTYTLDPGDLEAKVTEATRAIVAVDAFGHPCLWDEVTAVARRHGLKVVDDSCEALGARYRGVPVGRFGDAAAFAFYPNKQVTTGEGGMIVTADPEVAELCRSWRNQGRARMGSWLAHEYLGYNYRMDEMSAALGVSQMGRVEGLLQKRQAVAERYDRLLADVPWLSTPRVRSDVRMSWFVYVVTVQEGMSRDAVVEGLAARGIPARGYFSAIHLQPYVRALAAEGRIGGAQGAQGAGSLPVTENVCERTIALPFHGNLPLEQAEAVVEALAEVGATLG